MMDIHFLPAYGGDFLWLRFGTPPGDMHNIIIDSGYKSCHLDLMSIMRSISGKGETVDAVVLTHVDDDHIGGFLRWLGEESGESHVIQKIFFNTELGISEHLGKRLRGEEDFFENSIQCGAVNENYGVSSACSLLQLLTEKHLLEVLCPYSAAGSLPVKLPLGASLRFISPSEKSAEAIWSRWPVEQDRAAFVNYGTADMDICEGDDLDALPLQGKSPDASISNGACLAFLFDFEDTHLAFLGDAHADICEEGLSALGYSVEKPYHADIVKLSHHGSVRNLSPGLLARLDCGRFMLSSDTSKIKRAQKETVALLLRNRRPIKLYLNCNLPRGFFSKRDRAKFIDTKQLEIYDLGFGGTDKIEIKAGLSLYGKTRRGLYDGRI